MALLSLSQAKSRLELYHEKAKEDEFGRFDVRYSDRVTFAILYSEDEKAFAYLWGERFVDQFVALQAIMSFEEKSR